MALFDLLARSVATALCLGVTAVPAAPVDAAGAGDSDFSLTVSPTRLVVPGDSVGVKRRILVVNGGRDAINIKVDKRDFVAQPDGSLSFAAAAPYSARDWVTVTPAAFRLPPKSRRAVSVSVTVPPKPDVGDHQVALVFLSLAGRDGGNIKINRGIGAPVYIAVPGPVDDAVRLTRFVAPRFALGGPIHIRATAQSVGTVHHDFRDAARLKIAVAGRTVEFPDFTVVRGATRDVVAEWRHPPLFCFCAATVSVPTRDGPPQVLRVQLVIIPLHLIGGAVLLIVVAGGALYLARRRYRAQVLAAARALRADDG